MIQNFKIDQAATFDSIRLLSVAPKTAFGDQYRQESTKDGVPKWEAQVVAGFRQFGRTQNEIIKVGIAAGHDPGEGIAPDDAVRRPGTLPGSGLTGRTYVQVFISWSGEPSRSVARALRQWLPLVVQHVRPWMSDEEIGSGTRWNDRVATALNETDFGIVCVTRSNQHQPWLMFEAGALAKRLETAAVVPICVDIAPAEVTGPLEAFQGRCLDEDGMRRLVHDISRTREEPLGADQVDKLFDRLWLDLKAVVDKAWDQVRAAATPRRSPQDMLEELVERVRRLERNQPLPLIRVAPGDSVTVGERRDNQRADPWLPSL